MVVGAALGQADHHEPVLGRQRLQREGRQPGPVQGGGPGAHGGGHLDSLSVADHSRWRCSRSPWRLGRQPHRALARPGDVVGIVPADEEADQVGGPTGRDRAWPTAVSAAVHQVGTHGEAVGEAARHQRHASRLSSSEHGSQVPSGARFSPLKEDNATAAANRCLIRLGRCRNRPPSRPKLVAAGSARGDVGSIPCQIPEPRTLRELRASGHIHRTVKAEIRENLLARCGRASRGSPASSASTTPSCPTSSAPCSPGTTWSCSASAARARPG